MDTATPLYKIPAENLATFETKFGRLVRRAERLGVTAPTFEVVATEEREIDPGRYRTYHHVVVTGEAPHYDGWTLAAVIDRDLAEGGLNVVHAVSGPADPAWYALPEQCDHCHVASRGRKQLVVVDHENGSRRIVGTTCLGDFLGGTSPERVAGVATYLADLDSLGDDDEIFEPSSGGGEYRYGLASYLTWVALVIRDTGWTPRSAARYGDRIATADLAILAQDEHRKSTSAPVPSDADEATAAGALEWAKTLEIGDNDYLNNLVVIASKTTISPKHIGLAASLVPAWQKEMGYRAEREAKAKAGAASNHFGQVKERLDIVGTVTFVRFFDSDFGTRALVKILTDEGNQVTWWASNASSAPEIGDKVAGKATVKGHETYRDEASTVITRPKFTVTSAEVPCGDSYAHASWTCGCPDEQGAA